MKNYNVDYFYRKFSAIPDKLWNVGSQTAADGTSCALGHCRQVDDYCGTFREQGDLAKILAPLQVEIIKKVSCNSYSIGYIIRAGNNYIDKVAAINNGETAEYQQATPKARILAALGDIKKLYCLAKYQPVKRTRVIDAPSIILIDEETLIFNN